LSGKTWSTELEVWLTAKGEFHSAYIKKSSGYQPFDEAAVYAFKNARLFPNPPKAKVEPDGFVRLRYRFNINVAAYQ
jgi:TonB family protein